MPVVFTLSAPAVKTISQTSQLWVREYENVGHIHCREEEGDTELSQWGSGGLAWNRLITRLHGILVKDVSSMDTESSYLLFTQ
jgi:hypothetical protein